MNRIQHQSAVARLRGLIGSVAMAVSLSAAAGPYDYIEGGFLDARDGRDDDAGVRIAGSVDLDAPVALFGEISDTGPVTRLSTGALYHQRLEPRLDLVLGASLEAIDAGRGDDVGPGLRGGLRWWLDGVPLEISPQLRLAFLDDRTDASLRTEGLFEIAPPLLIQSAVQIGDEDRLEIGLRYRF